MDEEMQPYSGSAFPVIPPLGADQQPAAGYPYPDPGMSLRDWFAGQALAGYLASCAGMEVSLNPRHAAQYDFEAADAMLAARSM